MPSRTAPRWPRRGCLTTRTGRSFVTCSIAAGRADCRCNACSVRPQVDTNVAQLKECCLSERALERGVDPVGGELTLAAEKRLDPREVGRGPCDLVIGRD